MFYCLKNINIWVTIVKEKNIKNCVVISTLRNSGNKNVEFPITGVSHNDVNVMLMCFIWDRIWIFGDFGHQILISYKDGIDR